MWIWNKQLVLPENAILSLKFIYTFDQLKWIHRLTSGWWTVSSSDGDMGQPNSKPAKSQLHFLFLFLSNHRSSFVYVTKLLDTEHLSNIYQVPYGWGIDFGWVNLLELLDSPMRQLSIALINKVDSFIITVFWRPGCYLWWNRWWEGLSNRCCSGIPPE